MSKVTPEEFADKLNVIIETLNDVAEENDINWCLFATTYETHGSGEARNAILTNCTWPQILGALTAYAEQLVPKVTEQIKKQQGL